MKKFFVSLLEHLTKSLKKDSKINFQLEKIIEEPLSPPIKTKTFPIEVTPELIIIDNADKTSKKKLPKNAILTSVDPRDVMETMGIPFVALSKNRTAPIIYESSDGKIKVRISCHPPHYVASIYDWDIIVFISSKMQELINSGSDIPPRTLVFSKNEILKAIHRHNGKKQEKDLRASLSRLKLTGIETTIRNKDGRYDAGFGFLDSWDYTDRKDVKEIKITISNWLYNLVCAKGSLLKVHPEYFDIKSGLKKFLYRTARKHVGVQNESWNISLETLYKKSGSEQEFKKFKYDLKKAIDGDIPGYSLEWIEAQGKASITFLNMRNGLNKICAT